MTKTWLTLPKRTLVRLKDIARRRKTTVSLLLRDPVEKTYGIDSGLKHKLDWKKDSFLKLIGTFGGGPSDLSVNHDHYLYGAAKKKPRG